MLVGVYARRSGVMLARTTSVSRQWSLSSSMFSTDSTGSDNDNPRAEQQEHQRRRGRNKYSDFSQRRIYRDPETGFTEGGRLNLCFKPEQMPNSGLVPLDLREEIYQAHKTDPEGKGNLQRLAYITGLPVKKIQGIIKIVELEKQHEKETGEMLDRTLDQEFRKVFGEKRNWRGEFDKGEAQAERARTMQGHWRWMMANDPDVQAEDELKGQYESITGFFKPWRKLNEFNGEEVVKRAPKAGLMFLKPGSGAKKNKSKK